MKVYILAVLVLTTGCVQSTGGALVDFGMTASGPASAVKGQPYTFTTPENYRVTLTRAELTVGAVYLNQNSATNYQVDPACILPGVYSGEVRGGRVIDVLDPTPQAFDTRGNGTDTQTLAAELWLTGGDIQADTDASVVMNVAGRAERGADAWPFEARVTIGQNRRVPPRDPALPGTNPLCKQRIISPIATQLTLKNGGTLRLRVDPARWFDAVDFDELTAAQQVRGVYQLVDALDGAGQPDLALFNGLRTTRGPYSFEFTP